MNDYYPKQTSQDNEPDLEDNLEKDPQGWQLKPVPEQDVSYVDIMEERGRFDSINAGRSIGTLQEQLQPGSKLVVVGRENPGPSAFIRLSTDLTFEMRQRQGAPLSAGEQNPGLVATFSNLPTPEELESFLAKNSPEAGYTQGWSHTGEVPYMALYGDAPGAVEYGTMNAQSQTRTQAARVYHDGSHR